MTTWFDKFPLEVQVEITERLPLKSLLRLMSTCKSIDNNIRNLTPMLTTSLRDTGYHIYSYCVGGTQRFLLCQDTVEDFKFGKEMTNIEIDVDYFLLGSSHGLVCFAKTLNPKDSDIILWNPFLVKTLMLPIPVVASEKSCAIGFGFDHQCIDYKVVRVGIVPGCSNPCIWADIYVLRAGNWKTVVGSLSRPVSSIMGDGVFVNNTIHWILKYYHSNGSHQDYPQYSILGYNLHKEVFHELPIEETMSRKLMFLTTLKIHGEEKLVLYRDGDQHQSFYIWVMEEYGVAHSWAKICIMESKSQQPDVFLKVLGHTRKNGEIVLSMSNGNGNGRVILRKIEDDGKTSARIMDYTGPQLDYVGPFMASLVFLDEKHCGGTLISGKRTSMEEYEKFDKLKGEVAKRTSENRQQGHRPLPAPANNTTNNILSFVLGSRS